MPAKSPSNSVARVHAQPVRHARRSDWESARAKAFELGFEALSPADLDRLMAALEAERIAKLQLASADAARRPRGARS